VAEEVPGDDAEQDDDEKREEHAEQRQGRGLVQPGDQQPQHVGQDQVVEPHHDRGDGPDRDADGGEEEDAGDEVAADRLAQHRHDATGHIRDLQVPGWIDRLGG
jgi:hypothetical protein